MTILSLLKEDHRKIKSLLKDLKSSGKKEGIFRELHELVYAHSKAEEKTFYEPLKENKKARPLAFEGYEEHHVVSNLLKELEHLSSDDERWTAKLTVVDEALHHHIKEEESEMFALAKNALSSSELVDAGKKFLSQKKLLSNKSLRQPERPVTRSIAGGARM